MRGWRAEDGRGRKRIRSTSKSKSKSRNQDDDVRLSHWSGGGRGSARRAVEVTPSLHSHMKRYFHLRQLREIARVRDGRKGAQSRGVRRADAWELKLAGSRFVQIVLGGRCVCASFLGTFQFILNGLNLCDREHWLIPFLA
jgi:hypothetical protein